jgi:hypothetical protein
VTALVATDVDVVVVVPDVLEGGWDVGLAGSIHCRGYISSRLMLPQGQEPFCIAYNRTFTTWAYWCVAPAPGRILTTSPALAQEDEHIMSAIPSKAEVYSSGCKRLKLAEAVE